MKKSKRFLSLLLALAMLDQNTQVSQLLSASPPLPRAASRRTRPPSVPLWTGTHDRAEAALPQKTMMQLKVDHM